MALSVFPAAAGPAGPGGPIDTWPITHGIDCEGDPYNPLDENGDRDPDGDPKPGTAAFKQRDDDNKACTGQRSSDRRFHPTGGTNAATYGQDFYRQPLRWDDRRFRFDSLTRLDIPDVPSAEVYRPCPTDRDVCRDMPAGLTRFDGPYPVVVIFHGFTASKELHRMNAQTFAEAGYLAISVNGTHVVGSAPNSQRTQNGDDVLNWLASESSGVFGQDADLDRVAFVGHSQGSAAARSYQGDERVHTIIAWDGGDDVTEDNVAQPIMFQRTDGGFATTNTYTDVPGTVRGDGFRHLRERGVDVMHVTARATVHVDWNGNGGPGMNRLWEATSNYYNLAWLDRYLKGRLVLDDDGGVVSTGGRTAVQERAYRQSVAFEAYQRLIADTFDGSVDKHNISQGFWDPVKAATSGDPLWGGNVPYRLQGKSTRDRWSYYYRSVCSLSVPNYVGGSSGAPGDPRPPVARADSGLDGDMRIWGCPEVRR